MWEILRHWPLFKSVRCHRQKKEEPTNSTVRWITGQMTASFLREHLCECTNRTTQHCANHRTLQAETISRHARSAYSAAGICLPRLFFVMSYTNQPLCIRKITSRVARVAPRFSSKPRPATVPQTMMGTLYIWWRLTRHNRLWHHEFTTTSLWGHKPNLWIIAPHWP